MSIFGSVAQGAQSVADSITGAIDGVLGRSNEESRQLAANDGKYYRNIVSFFELQTPTGNFLFPFVYNFQSISLSEPFSVQIVPTLDSGLVVHRSGIMQRRLQLAGSTGFAPHPLPMPLPVPFSASTLPKNYYDRSLQRKAFNMLSGQRHLQYLQSVIVRLYSDLVIDRSTAAQTKLFFHCPQEDEHWRVEPLDFRVGRSAASPLTYTYSIDLALIGPAAAQVFPVADVDKGFLSGIRDSVFAVNKALGGLRAAVNDLTALQGSIRLLGYQVTGILAQANTVIDAVNNFVTGIKPLIEVPLRVVKSLFATIEKTMAIYAQLAATGTSLANWPRIVRGRFRSMQNSINLLLSQPQTFTVPLNRRLSALSSTGVQRLAATDVQASTSFGQLTAAGSANLPGDAALASLALTAGPALPQYKSIKQVTVRQGDTLASIAQAQLGSSAYWRALVVLNDISAPYTCASGVTISRLEVLRDTDGVLVPGRTLLVPSTAPPPTSVQTPEVVGVSPDADQQEQAFGRDLQLTPKRPGRAGTGYTFVLVQLPDGTQDIATVAGSDNLSQYLNTQLTTRRGANVLYPSVGMDKVVGSGLAAADVPMATYRVTQAITRSARVRSLESLEVSDLPTGTKVSAQVQTILGQAVGVSATIGS